MRLFLFITALGACLGAHLLDAVDRTAEAYPKRFTIGDRQCTIRNPAGAPWCVNVAEARQ